MSDQTSTAIQAALANDWEKAISINKSILKENPDDVNTMNRLAFALTQIRKLDEAKKLYKKILKVDKYNTIAHKNLEKIESYPKSNKTQLQNKIYSLSPSLFIEEPRKTKTVTLTDIAPSSILSHINIGDETRLVPKRHSLEVRTCNKVYLGALPDDIAFRLLRLIKAGNTYQVNIKNVSKNSISVFIREIKRGKRYANQPSFISLLSEHKNLIPPQQEKEEDKEDENSQDDLDE